jgi:hypothetical protein
MPFPNKETQFKKGQSGNPNGTPKKTYSQHIDDIKSKGYIAPTKTEYYDMIGLLLSMNEDDLKEFAKDTERPYWIRIIVIDMNKEKTRQNLMIDYRDWLFGKAQLSVDHTNNGKEFQAQTIIIQSSGEIPEKT